MSVVAPTPVVSVDGRTVTISFVMPFMVGDECITPRHYQKTKVSRVPEISIQLDSDNLTKASIACHGAWYTADHTQVHGLSEFLPDEAAFLDYWLQEKREYFEGRLGDLKRIFAGNPDATRRLVNRQVDILQKEADELKAKLGASIVESTQKVALLEAAIAKAKGGAV